MFIKETFDIRKQYVTIDLSDREIPLFPGCVQKIALNITQPWDLVEAAKQGEKNYQAKFFQRLEESAIKMFSVDEDVPMSVQGVRYAPAEGSTFSGTLHPVVELDGITFGWCEAMGAYTPIVHLGDVPIRKVETSILLGRRRDCTRVEYSGNPHEFEIITQYADVHVEARVEVEEGRRLCLVVNDDEFYLGEIKPSIENMSWDLPRLNAAINETLVGTNTRVVRTLGRVFLSSPTPDSNNIKGSSSGSYFYKLLDGSVYGSPKDTAVGWYVTVKNRKITRIIPYGDGGPKVLAQVKNVLEHRLALMGIVEHEHKKSSSPQFPEMPNLFEMFDEVASKLH